jgi:hypothetical protein
MTREHIRRATRMMKVFSLASALWLTATLAVWAAGIL